MEAAIHQPVNYFGQPFTTEKNFFHGTHRTCSPAETLQKIRPLFKQVGLTRLPNITHLDHIGFPVVVSVRPASVSLAVDAGKGFTLEAATVSAAMEAIERYVGENAYNTLDLFDMSYRELEAQQELDLVPFDKLGLIRGHIFNRDSRVTWVKGWDIMNQRPVAVPYALTGLGVRPHSTELPNFAMNSNGLASGNVFLEAVLAGLYEVVERDATTCYQLLLSKQSIQALPKVDLESIEFPLVRELLEKMEKSGACPVIFQCTTDTQVPIFMAYIYDRQTRNLGIFKGYGAHLDPEIAMIRALTEAAQARLIFISGARDDMFKQDFLAMKQSDNESTTKNFERVKPTIDARLIPNQNTNTFQGDINVVLGKLRAVGLNQAIVVDLTPPGFDVSIVRVLVPGLEGYLFGNYRKGARANRFLATHMAERTGAEMAA